MLTTTAAVMAISANCQAVGFSGFAISAIRAMTERKKPFGSRSGHWRDETSRAFSRSLDTSVIKHGFPDLGRGFFRGWRWMEKHRQALSRLMGFQHVGKTFFVAAPDPQSDW